MSLQVNHLMSNQNTVENGINIKSNIIVVVGSKEIKFNTFLFPEDVKYWENAISFNKEKNRFICPEDWKYVSVISILNHYGFRANMRYDCYIPEKENIFNMYKICHEIDDKNILDIINVYFKETAQIINKIKVVKSNFIYEMFGGPIFKSPSTNLFQILNKTCGYCNNNVCTLTTRYCYDNIKLLNPSLNEKKSLDKETEIISFFSCLSEFYDIYDWKINYIIGIIAHDFHAVKLPKKFKISHLQQIIKLDFEYVFGNFIT